MIRLDKFIAQCGYPSRKDIKKAIQKGLVSVDEIVIKNPAKKIDESSQVIFNGKSLNYKRFIYIIMNKPKGVVSATCDNIHTTVIDLLSDIDKQYKPFCVGRLDIDTTGLILITNDGKLAHEMTSPKHHVKKAYIVTTAVKLSQEDIDSLEKGVLLKKENYITKPAKVNIISDNIYKLTISEGKFHQIKRMLLAVNNEVVALKRISIGDIKLPESLEEGKYIKINL